MKDGTNTRGVILSATDEPGEKEAAAILVEAKANAQRLRRCPGPHGFIPEGTTTAERKIGEPTGHLRCIRCNGRVTADQARWYKRGLADGRDNP